VPIEDTFNWVGSIIGDDNIRKFKEDEDGVAAVIGTIMGLMVFLAFISLFVMYWVPVMMEDNEHRHMSQVQNQFNDLKKTIDNQIALDDRNETMASPITLGADGVPMFEKETPGQLTLKPNAEFFNISFQDSGEDVFENSSGVVDLVVFNRFYIRQSVIYEHGAVIISQKKGEVMKAEPNFLVEKEGQNVIMTVTFISLLHESEESIGGIGPQTISTRLLYADKWTYTDLTDINQRVTLTINSKYADIWDNYYTTTFENAGLDDGTDFNTTVSMDTLTINIDRVSDLTLTHAFFEAYLGRSTA
jgi:hypothetical protein